MPILKPEITPNFKDIISKAGIGKNGIVRGNDLITTIEQMDAAGLTDENIFSALGEIMNSGDTDTVKLAAIRTALETKQKIRGDGQSGNNSVNIVIQDNASSNLAINPILLPRQ